jgi:hypothetical protein
MERNKLIATLKVVGKALSTNTELPAFSSFFFNKKRVSAYDDVLSISSECDLEAAGGVPGKFLQTWLSSCSGDEVKIDSKKKAIKLACGRSKIGFDLLAEPMFVFKRPTEPGTLLMNPFELMRALEQCYPFITSNPQQSWMDGLTVEFKDGEADIYGTNGHSLSHATAVVANEGELGGTVLLPNRFVKTILAMHKTNPVSSLEIGDSWVEATLDDQTTVFSRTSTEVNVKVLADMAANMLKLAKDWIPINPEMEEIIERVKSVASVAKDDPKSKLTIGDGTFTLGTSATGATLSDLVPFEGKHPKRESNFNPKYLHGCTKSADELCLTDSVFLARSPGFLAVLMPLAK